MVIQISCLIGFILGALYIGQYVIGRVEQYRQQREFEKHWETWGDDTDLRKAA